jgi:hypothetical protein
MSGRWEERELAWHQTSTRNCPVCGRLVTRRSWVFDGGDGELAACSPECEELYFSYYQPTHGTLSGDAHH